MKEIALFKRDGKVENMDVVMRSFGVLLNLLKNGEYRIAIEAVRHQRSLPQNRLLWLWLTFIEEQTGQDKEDLKDFFASMFLAREIEINGKTERIVVGTSRLKKDEMTEFLEKISLWCAENLGITLPSPDDLRMMGYE